MNLQADIRRFLTMVFIFLMTILIFNASDRLDCTATDNPDLYEPIPKTIRNTTINTDLIQYAYYENEDAMANLEFFVKHALHSKADFVFIIQGGILNVAIPQASNIKVILRPNTCFDIGAHRVVLEEEGALKKYKRFILMNSSLRGPFFPKWAQNACWSEKYFEKLQGKTKMVGMTANCKFGYFHDQWIEPHLQSMLYALDHTGLEVILPQMFCYKDYIEAILKGETVLTKMVLDAGYQAEPMMTAATTTNFWTECESADLLHKESYYGMDFHPFDTL